MDKLRILLETGKIDKFEYDTYFLFGFMAEGKSYLKNMQDMVLMEEPHIKRRDSYAWQDGRRSCWREIQTTINLVNLKIEELTNDGSSNHPDRKHDSRCYSERREAIGREI